MLDSHLQSYAASENKFDLQAVEQMSETLNVTETCDITERNLPTKQHATEATSRRLKTFKSRIHFLRKRAKISPAIQKMKQFPQHKSQKDLM